MAGENLPVSPGEEIVVLILVLQGILRAVRNYKMKCYASHLVKFAIICFLTSKISCTLKLLIFTGLFNFFFNHCSSTRHTRKYFVHLLF